MISWSFYGEFMGCWDPMGSNGDVGDGKSSCTSWGWFLPFSNIGDSLFLGLQHEL